MKEPLGAYLVKGKSERSFYERMIF